MDEVLSELHYILSTESLPLTKATVSGFCLEFHCFSVFVLLFTPLQ